MALVQSWWSAQSWDSSGEPTLSLDWAATTPAGDSRDSSEMQQANCPLRYVGFIHCNCQPLLTLLCGIYSTLLCDLFTDLVMWEFYLLTCYVGVLIVDPIIGIVDLITDLVMW